MKVFVDTNVLLDVIAKREPFYADSATIWTLSETGRIEGLVSAITFTNLFYVVRKLADAKTARRVMILLRESFTPTPCDASVLNLAIDSDFKDFEDAVQYYSAVQANADCMVSRNPNDFPRGADCPILTPSEFLTTYAFDA